MFAELNDRQRSGVIVLALAVGITAGLVGAVCGALARASSLVLYLFYDWCKFWECFQEVEVACGVGAICGVAAGLSWTFLFVRSALHLREQSAGLFTFLTALGRGALFGLVAWLLFTATFLAWSMIWGHDFSPFTGVVLVVTSSVKWLFIGVGGGAIGWYALKQ